MTTEELQITRREGVVEVVFNRPERRNAFTAAMYAAMRELCDDLREDTATRVLLAVIDNTDPRAGSRFVGSVERAYGKDLTMRSWLTVKRVARALQA